jgi:hypothetical protein
MCGMGRARFTATRRCSSCRSNRAITGCCFPKTEPLRLPFDEPQPYGNAIRKAYLCHSKIKGLQPGATLLFYKSKGGNALSSGNEQSIQCVGVVERVVRSQSAETIAREVGRRTVYRYTEIEAMTRERPVLAILFRHAIILEKPIKLAELRAHDLLGGVPQSIAQVRAAGLVWTRTRIIE